MIFGNGCLLLADFGPSNVEYRIGSSSDGNGTGAGIGNTSANIGIHSSSSSSCATKGEAKKVAYHRFFKKGNGRYNMGQNNNSNNEDDENDENHQLNYK